MTPFSAIFPMKTRIFALFLLFSSFPVCSSNNLTTPTTDVQLAIGEITTVTFRTTEPIYSDVLLWFNNSIYVDILNQTVISKENGTGTLWIRGKRLTTHAILEAAGCRQQGSNDTCPLDLSNTYVRVSVIQSKLLDVFVDLVGWAYFFAWSISFYPQIFLNMRRKSVVGLNFDFLFLNVIGFTAYTCYNLLVYFNATVEEEYELQHPRSPIPVLLNDVVFAVHAMIACLMTAFQCVIYERENQRVTRPCLVLASILILLGVGSGLLSLFNVYNALAFVTSLSYIKMVVTLCKYFPQAFYNFHRKSTVGWSIGNVLLDFTGGTLDILQMVLQAINVGDASGFYGNPVKFGLGLVSICFDVVFIVQHYVLYRYAVVAHNEFLGIDNPESPTVGVMDYGSGDAASANNMLPEDE